MPIPDDWAPEACTLPTAERSLRVAEFDELFAEVLRFARAAPTRLDLVLSVGAESTARGLADRERRCCTFFTFDFESCDGNVVMRIGVPPKHVDVLDALEARLAH